MIIVLRIGLQADLAQKCNSFAHFLVQLFENTTGIFFETEKAKILGLKND
jgi:hypothetical protein